MRFRSLGALGAFAVLAALMLVAVSAFGLLEHQRPPTSRLYIVQMLDERRSSPTRAASPGYAATKPAKGQKLDPNSAAVKKYVGLSGRQARERARRRSSARRSSTTTPTSFNGFAAEMTRAAGREAREASPACVAVSTDEMLSSRHLDDAGRSSASTAPGRALGQGSAVSTRPARTSSSASSTPASGPSTRASRTARTSSSGPATAASGKLAYRPDSAGWTRQVPVRRAVHRHDMCNKKLIGAQLLLRRLRSLRGHRPSATSCRPRDHNGHGSHTASTAGGNTASRRPAQPRRSARSAAWRRARASPRTRSAGTGRATAAAPTPTASPRSTRPSPTAST